MVRSVLADEGHLESHVDALFHRKASQEVGLVIGKSGGGTKDLIFALIRTPLHDGKNAWRGGVGGSGVAKDAAKRKGTKVAKDEVEPLVLDDDWIAEHGRQVSRMLVGGVSVVGLYFFGPDPLVKASGQPLWQTASAVASSSLIATPGSTPVADMLLLHICSNPKRYSCRSCRLGGSFSASSLAPADLKLGKVLGNFQMLTCNHGATFSLPAWKSSKGKSPSLRQLVERALVRESAKLDTARAMCEGKLVQASEMVRGSGETMGGGLPLEVELLVQATWQEEGGEGGDVGCEGEGSVRVSGHIHGCSLAYGRGTMGKAVEDLKADIMASLRTRLDLMVEEAEGEEGEEGEEESSSKHPLLQSTREIGDVFSAPFSRRVVVPWVGGLVACDYMQWEETIKDVEERCVEMLAHQILEPILEVEGVGHVSDTLTKELWRPWDCDVEAEESDGEVGPPMSKWFGWLGVSEARMISVASMAVGLFGMFIVSILVLLLQRIGPFLDIVMHRNFAGGMLNPKADL